MLEVRKCCLVIVDVQGKLAQRMVDKEALFTNIQILIRAAQILDLPLLWCQQVPEALGPTVPAISELLTGHEPINKASFSCCGHEPFTATLSATGRKQILLCGIEAHVCICQTAADLLSAGYEVTVIADAVSSRTARNRDIALTRLGAEGVHISSTEMALFELLKTAEHPHFKEVVRLIK